MANPVNNNPQGQVPELEIPLPPRIRRIHHLAAGAILAGDLGALANLQQPPSPPQGGAPSDLQGRITPPAQDR